MPDVSGIVVRGQLRALDIHRCERPPARRGCVVIDLQRMSWCEPAGLVALAALAEQATAQDYGVILRAPRNANVANYLGRMRLGRVMRELGAEHDLPVVRERPLETSLVELVPLSDEGDCDGAAASVRDATEAKCGSPVADRLYETLIKPSRTWFSTRGRHSGSPPLRPSRPRSSSSSPLPTEASACSGRYANAEPMTTTLRSSSPWTAHHD